MTTITHRRGHRLSRKLEYPELSKSDTAEMLCKTVIAIRDGSPLPAEVLAWAAQCESVRAKFPKDED